MIKVCNMILSYLKENQKPFLAPSIEKKNFFFSIIYPYVFFNTGPVKSTKKLKSYIPKTGLFLCLLSVIFGFLILQKTTHTKF